MHSIHSEAARLGFPYLDNSVLLRVPINGVVWLMHRCCRTEKRSGPAILIGNRGHRFELDFERGFTVQQQNQIAAKFLRERTIHAIQRART